VRKGSQDRCALGREAINIVKRERAYHILIIIADGQGTAETSRTISSFFLFFFLFFSMSSLSVVHEQ
jgi:serine/threonine protein phosphatase PrpC